MLKVDLLFVTIHFLLRMQMHNLYGGYYKIHNYFHIDLVNKNSVSTLCFLCNKKFQYFFH